MAETVLKIKKWGSSFASIIPSKTIKTLGLKEGDNIKAELSKIRGSGFGIWKGEKLPKFERDRDEHKWK